MTSSNGLKDNAFQFMNSISTSNYNTDFMDKVIDVKQDQTPIFCSQRRSTNGILASDGHGATLNLSVQKKLDTFFVKIASKTKRTLGTMH